MLLTEETKTDLQVWFQYYLCPNNKIVVAGFYSEGPIIVCFLFQDYFKFQPNIISSHCGQSYKASTIIIYNARVVNYEHRGFIGLATDDRDLMEHQRFIAHQQGPTSLWPYILWLMCFYSYLLCNIKYCFGTLKNIEG